MSKRSRLRRLDDRAVAFAERVRKNPNFDWSHPWMMGDLLAVVFFVAGLFDASRALSHSHYLGAVAWVGMSAGGVLLFLALSLIPRESQPDQAPPGISADASLMQRTAHWLRYH